MAFFDDFTSALRQRWLQYFQLNHAWMTLQMELESIKTPDGGRRPPSYLILGVLNALEPKLAQLMLPFTRLNSDADALIDVLDLNFDPDIALGNHPPTKMPVPQALISTDISSEEPIDEELESGDEVGVALGGMMLDDEEPANFGGMALDVDVDAAEVELDEETADFGGMALDDLDADATELDSEEEIGDFGGVALDDVDADATELADDDEMADFGGMALDDLDTEAAAASGEVETADFDAMSMADLDLDTAEDSDDALADFGDIALDEESSKEESALDLSDLASDAWTDESEELNEESLTDLGSISFDAFGESSEEDAFGDMTFEELDEGDSKEEDEWSK